MRPPIGLVKQIAEEIDKGSWWAVLLVLIGSLLLIFILTYPIFFMKFN